MGSSEIDKESLFRKIMPSAAAAKDEAAQQESPPPEPGATVMKQPAAVAEVAIATPGSETETPLPHSEADAKNAPAGAEAGQTAEAAIPSRPAAGGKEDLLANLDMALQDFALSVQGPGTEEAQPVNIMELLVERYYPRYQQRLGGCECQRCKDDVCGMALNKIQPRYTTTDKLTEQDLQNRELITETVTALIRAIFIVKRSPHHDDFGSVRM